jgi:DNA repair protein RecN (Recombination protein N)
VCSSDLVEQDFQRASNAARLLELSQSALNLLSEEEGSLFAQSAELGRILQSLERTDPGAAELTSAHESAASALRDLQLNLRHYADRISVDPARLAQLEERLNLIHSLKRKYGSTLAAVIAFGDEAKGKLRKLEEREVQVERLNGELERLYNEMRHTGQELSRARHKSSPKLGKAVMEQLKDLGFAQSHFEAVLRDYAPEPSALQASGFDQIEFQFAPNPGEPARPLRAIASSGEMSRIMLALKRVLAAQDSIPVLVFDEIDANVGGETARVVGEKIQEIARQHQVICITHLPPVAACAAAHFVVTKHVEAGRTASEISRLEGNKRIDEIARMLGGRSEAALKHARELLSSSSSLK